MTRGAGFFRELSYCDDSSPSILDSTGRLPSADKQRVLRYLMAGTVAEELLLVTTDVLHEDRPPIGGLELLTDGEWLWPSDLAYYIEIYDCGIPDAFREHMATRKWKPRAISATDIDEVMTSLSKDDEEELDDA